MADAGVGELTLHRVLWYFPLQGKRPFEIPIPRSMDIPRENVSAEAGQRVFSTDAGGLNRARQLIWTLQGAGLVLVTVLSFFPRLFHLEEYVFFTLLALAALTTWREGRSLWIRTPIDLPLLLFVGWVLLTIPFAQDPAYSFGEWRKLAAQVFVFYWAVMVIDRCHAMDLRQRVMEAIILGTTILSLWGLVDFFLRGGTFVDRYVRASAPFSDYNWLGTYLIIGIPFIALRFWQADSAGFRIVLGMAFVIGSLTLFATYSRASWLGLAAQVVAFGLVTKRYKLVGSALGGVVLVGLVLVFLTQVGYQRDTVDPWTVYTRVDVWGKGIDEILRHPIGGIGYGYHTFEPVISGHPKGNGPMGLHNTFLMIGGGTGIIGLSLFLWLLVKSVHVNMVQFQANPTKLVGLFALAVAMMIVGFAVRNVFDYMFAGGTAYVFWILIGLGMSQFLQNRRRACAHGGAPGL